MATNNRQQSACDELHDLLPGYVIGAATADEVTRVQELLALCPEALSELADYAAISEGFLDQVAPVAPPPALHDRLMAALHEENSTPDKVIPLEQPSQQPTSAGGKRLWWLLAAAASVLLVISNVYWVARLNTAQGEIDDLQTQREVIAQIASQNSFQRISLGDAEENSSVMRAIVLWDGENNEAWLYSDALPPLPQERTYQLWLIGGDGPTSAGIFATDADGTTLYNFRFDAPLSEYDALGISIEPASGSDAPTTNPIAVGDV